MTASANVKQFMPQGQAPAVGTSIQVDIGAGGVMVLQTHFAQDASPGEVDRLLDGMMRAAARQKAKAEIVVMTKNIEVQEKALADLDFQMAEAEATHRRQLAIAQEKMTAWTKDRADTESAGHAEHAKAGKRGTYEPSGARRARIAAIDGQIAKEKEAIQALETEKEKAARGREITRKSCEREIEANRKLIEERKALIGPSE